MINFFFIIIISFCFKYSVSKEINPIVIEENCKSCHGKNYSGNKLLHTKLTDLYDLAIEKDLITYNKPHLKNEQQIGHPTDEGNKLIGSVINEKLKYYVT